MAYCVDITHGRMLREIMSLHGVQQAGKVPARGRLLQAYQERKSWLLLPVVGVLLLGLISLSGSWECHKSNKVPLSDGPTHSFAVLYNRWTRFNSFAVVATEPARKQSNKKAYFGM